MSQSTLNQVSHPFVFHGQKTVSNVSEQITGINKVGYMQIKSNTDIMYIGASGVGANGFPLANGDSFPVIGASLERYYVSGNGSVSFLGNYSN